MIRVQTQDFNVPEEYHLISQDNSDGAVVTFVGKVRDFNDGSAVTDLT
ncbi:molybdenum cofactor biosynthesis protein MoaE, partial [Shewanella sp. 0m-11]